MVGEIEEFVQLLRKVSQYYPNIDFKWANAVEAFRAVLKLPKISPPNFSFELNENFLKVKTDKDIWGPQPFLSLRTHEGRYFRDDFINDDGNEWTYVFDAHTIDQIALSHIGVACNDKVGNTIVNVCDFKNYGVWESTVHHENDWIS